MPRTALRICPLCEATCGLTLTIEGTTVTGARGDRDDVFSRGFICPKGAAFGALDADPDRLRSPLVRRDGRLVEATWEEAYEAIAAAVPALVREYGAQSVGVVLGNPNTHTMAGHLYPPLLLKALGTRNLFTASTLDQMPKHVSSGLLRRPLRHPGPRPRPHRLPAARRGQPGRVERLPVHRPRLPRPAQGAARPRRDPGRRRPAPHPHRQARRPPPRAPARQRRAAARRPCPHPARREVGRARRARGTRPGTRGTRRGPR